MRIGYCDVLLSDLVYGRSIIAEKISNKAPQMKKEVYILPAPGFESIIPPNSTLGRLQVKIRLRKPILEALKFHKNLSEIKAAEARFGPASQQVVTI